MFSLFWFFIFLVTIYYYFKLFFFKLWNPFFFFVIQNLYSFNLCTIKVEKGNFNYRLKELQSRKFLTNLNNDDDNNNNSKLNKYLHTKSQIHAMWHPMILNEMLWSGFLRLHVGSIVIVPNCITKTYHQLLFKGHVYVLYLTVIYKCVCYI